MTLIDETTSILGDLVAMPTVSADTNLDLIAYAAERLTDCGATLSMMRDASGRKANLFATLGPERDGGIVLSGHTDVVPALAEEWTSDPFRLRHDGDRLFGRGACDMKGFIAATLAVAPRYAELDLERPVHFAFTYDEETGCHGARQLVDELGRAETRPAVAIIGEPTGMRIVEGHKGCYEYTTVFTGLEGHGSKPDAGVNAVESAARYIALLMELAADLRGKGRPESRLEPPWTTIQVGRVEGGTARNVIPGRCQVEWEMRPVSAADADSVKAALEAFCAGELLPAMRAGHPGAGIVIEVVGEVAGLEPSEDNEARRIVAALIGTNVAEVVPFGTEAGLFQSLGMSAVVCGPGSIDQAHKPDEYVTLAQLEACLDMLTGLSGELTA